VSSTTVRRRATVMVGSTVRNFQSTVCYYDVDDDDRDGDDRRPTSYDAFGRRRRKRPYDWHYRRVRRKRRPATTTVVTPSRQLELCKLRLWPDEVDRFWDLNSDFGRFTTSDDVRRRFRPCMRLSPVRIHLRPRRRHAVVTTRQRSADVVIRRDDDVDVVMTRRDGPLTTCSDVRRPSRIGFEARGGERV
jgi:hypothetical protein